MHTLSEGQIAELHIGFTGTMSALYLKNLGEDRNVDPAKITLPWVKQASFR